MRDSLWWRYANLWGYYKHCYCQGFTQVSWPQWLRVLVTRSVAIAPTLMVAFFKDVKNLTGGNNQDYMSTDLQEWMIYWTLYRWCSCRLPWSLLLHSHRQLISCMNSGIPGDIYWLFISTPSDTSVLSHWLLQCQYWVSMLVSWCRGWLRTLVCPSCTSVPISAGTAWYVLTLLFLPTVIYVAFCCYLVRCFQTPHWPLYIQAIFCLIECGVLSRNIVRLSAYLRNAGRPFQSVRGYHFAQECEMSAPWIGQGESNSGFVQP